jgi:phage tail-like protein
VTEIAVLPPMRRTALDLVVEAGASIETRVPVGPPPDDAGGPCEYRLRVRGLPPGWFTLATNRLELAPATPGEVLLVLHPPHDDRLAQPGRRRFTIDVMDENGETTVITAELELRPPGATQPYSSLSQYLPRVHREGDFLNRFLMIFQSVLDPIERRIDASHHYLDAGLTPAQNLDWLASWIGLPLPAGTPEPVKRDLLRRAIELYRWKGTRRALRDEIAMRTGARALVVENFDGLRLGHDAAMGVNTQLGVKRDGCVVVTLASSNGDVAQDAEALVQELKPAHVGQIVRSVAVT